MIEARASATIGFRPREFDRSNDDLVKAERGRLLHLMADLRPEDIDLPKRPSVAAAMARPRSS